MVRFPFANWYTRIRDPLAQSRKKIGRKWTRYTRWYTRVDSRKDEFVCTERHQELLEEGRRSCSQNRDRDAMSVSALSVRFPPPLSLFLSPTPLLDTSPSFESIFQVSWILRWNSFVFGVDLPLFASLSLPGFLFLSTRGGLLTRDYLAVYIYIYSEETSFDGRERNIFPNRNSPDTKTIDNRCCDCVLEILFIYLFTGFIGYLRNLYIINL